jgi:CDP-diacylglycerol--serine O-phosphatidyltransferase
MFYGVFTPFLMNKIRRNIPNAITCGNLFCGCLAIVKAFEGDLVWAAYLVGIAAVLDFFDGFAARLLKVSSPIGKDLDSLADMVTFGVVPGVVMFKLILIAMINQQISSGQEGDYFFNDSAPVICFVAFLIPVFSAIRLAKFNNDTRQTDSFIGVPTPTNAIFICSLPLIMKQRTNRMNADTNPFKLLVDVSGDPILAILHNTWILIAMVVLFSLLMIASIPLFSLKFKSFGWKGNEIRFTFLILALVLISTLHFAGIPLVIVLYILMSIANNLITSTFK